MNQGETTTRIAHQCAVELWEECDRRDKPSTGALAVMRALWRAREAGMLDALRAEGADLDALFQVIYATVGYTYHVLGRVRSLPTRD